MKLPTFLIKLQLLSKPASDNKIQCIKPHSVDYFSNQRLALIVGNSKYTGNALVNPKNDTNGVAAVLRKVGFEVSLNLDTQRDNLIELAEIMSR